MPDITLHNLNFVQLHLRYVKEGFGIFLIRRDLNAYNTLHSF